MHRPNRLQQMCKGMVEVLNKPLTVKMRTGIRNDTLLAHKLIPKLKNLGVQGFTLHGRTKRMHYYDTADWNYVEQCAQIAGDVPLFGELLPSANILAKSTSPAYICPGNGDIFSYADYEKHMTADSHLAGVMVARGALIKPWVFTEIKERKIWDISSRERFDILKDFCDFGLEHWGSDTQGVNKTRRFLLEWMSFLHRYVPVGLLETAQTIGHKIPLFSGRDDLETLMGSPIVSDWLKIRHVSLFFPLIELPSSKSISFSS